MDQLTVDDMLARFVLVSRHSEVIDRENPKLIRSYGPMQIAYSASRTPVRSADGEMNLVKSFPLWGEHVKRQTVDVVTFRAGGEANNV